jgi:glycosyltransferase involved in cell wall biosynthesis
MSELKKLIIMPAYNESDSIEKTINEIIEQTDGFDYLVVNDCSRDQTEKILKEGKYQFLNLPINLGIGGAVQAGYLYALENGYDIAVQIDGDGQHDVRYLPMMAAELEKQNASMVIGSRFLDKEGFQSSRIRRIGISYFTGLIRLLTGVRITDPTSGMRMVNREVISIFAKNYPRDYPEPESVVHLLRRGKKITEVPVVMRERQGGVSSIQMKRSIYYMIKVTLAILIEWIRR